MLPLDAPPPAVRPRRDWADLVRLALGLARRALPEDEEGAADVAQEAILKLLLVDHPPRSVEAWLRIVVARGVADLRGRAELERRAAADLRALAVASPADPHRVALARQILAGFPPATRRLLLLHADGVSNRDLARLVRGRRVDVTRRLHAALAKARRIASEAIGRDRPGEPRHRLSARVPSR